MSQDESHSAGEDGAATRVGFLLSDDFPLVTFSAAVEPYRAANEVVGAERYRWRIMTEDGNPVRSSSGIEVSPDTDFREPADDQDGAGFDMVFVVGSPDFPLKNEAQVLARLRFLASRGVMLGAITGGIFLLARAGLLDGYRCAVHWYFASSFRESFPKVVATNRLFEIDRNRCTCSGGTASLDMMLTMMSDALGRSVANEISGWFLHNRIRDVHDEQSIGAMGELSVSSAVVTRAVEVFKANLETPIQIAAVAQKVGVTVRQLKRLFKDHLQISPSRYFRQERLKRARELLLYTNMPVSEISLAAGFSSHSHFTRCYRMQYGRSPYADQKALRR
ncbi:GlxA family transcriptional regulator [Rhodobium gokarnense]|uniref:Transcriptional regulator GlxA family with amidase domain n=1 Tax=Rhodobium gokarnense TaxID=364296 RepID=A0ABT3H5P3_9HYPH|nr:GlxA family transcriptional regulator [Rhodobium gokarnense]MCW2305689.1 transcriptional regulator GlxA family with amidase domain [Rhodobium gokarnense]